MLYLLANIILYNMAKNRKSKKKVTSDQSDLSSAKGSGDMINVCPSRVCSLFYLCFSCIAFSVYLLITTYIHTSVSILLQTVHKIRYQHSRIRPYFSGCGRSVMDTMEEIRQGKLEPNALPPIQVLVGPTDNDCPWYFSLNNRRLWIFKQCYKEGLLERYNNTIAVRVRLPKSDTERERYCIQNCALEAKFIRESDPNKKKTKVKAEKKDGKSEMDTNSKEGGDTTQLTNDFRQMSTSINDEDDDSSDESIDDDQVIASNPFALDSDSESSSDDDD